MFLVKFPIRWVTHELAYVYLLAYNLFKWVEIEIFAFFQVYDNIFANISQSMRPRGKIVEVENIPREILYKFGHSKVRLDLRFNQEIH